MKATRWRPRWFTVVGIASALFSVASFVMGARPQVWEILLLQACVVALLLLVDLMLYSRAGRQ